MPAEHDVGLIDTNIVILREWISDDEIPEQVAISAITLAELSAGPHAVTGDDAQAARERVNRTTILQRAEAQFDPIPFGPAAARLYGRISGAVIATGRSPRRRIADLQIAATAAAHDLPLYTTNPDDFCGLDEIVTVVPVTRPAAAP